MPQVVIENPILNSPYKEPSRHFKFSDEGITNEIAESRRISSYFIPIARPKKKGGPRQLALSAEWTEDRIEENEFINRIRERVSVWRRGGYVGMTKTTRHLLEYWTNPERERKLFFCQIEALETAIYLSEVANKFNDSWIENTIREQNEANNPGLYRIAFKMATGSGKTVVMAMLIAWQVLNKLADPQNAKFADSFLIVTPGITIRDRLRVLYPNDPQNYYQQRDIVPLSQMDELGRAKILITNFHTFKLKELEKTSKLTKHILANGKASALTETPDQMVRRVCREFGAKKNIVVINDEAHHCYRHKVETEDAKLTGDDRKEAEKREEEARVWISGLEAVKNKIGIKQIYDLSATPFFLRGSGYSEGTLFPWVVSDFSLIDAIESGIVKVPRVPVSDDAMQGDTPVYRDIWLRIRDHLPKRGRNASDEATRAELPKELEGALNSLYGNYEKSYRQWEQNTEARNRGSTPPVFIVVCSNTSVSKLVYDWIAGYNKMLPDGNEVVVPGNLKIFDNSDGHTEWLASPNTILIDSEQLESGEAMSKEFKNIAGLAIEEFKDEYKKRFPGRSTEDLTDEDLLREVMNTVGKQGKLGENIRCVVSVSMLTEGWDANTVTHIMGVRAFGTQLLCEQVVGRALRRRSYEANADGMFETEYAEVYGVPFSFIPCSGSSNDPKPPRAITRVRALDERIAYEITFPHVIGYKYEVPQDRLTYTFTQDSKMVLSPESVPTMTETAPAIGESTIHQLLYAYRNRREQEVVFQLAKAVLDKYFKETDGNARPWLFPQLIIIAREWIAKCVTMKDNAFIQMLLIAENRHYAAERIYNAIIWQSKEKAILRPMLRAYDNTGSTRYVDFDTTRAVYATNPNKCHLNYMVADTTSWEQKMAQALEDMDEVLCYVKNQGLEFAIPYVIEGEEKKYYPDFIIHLKDARGEVLNLILEVTGEKKKEKAAKVAAARNLWVPAINNHGSFGKWAFIEISDPWDAKNTIRGMLRNSQLV